MNLGGLTTEAFSNRLSVLFTLIVGLGIGTLLLEAALYWLFSRVLRTRHALAFTLLAALVLAFTRTWSRRIPQEALIGVIYVVAAAAAILLIDRAPQGAEHLKQILTGNILTTGEAELLTIVPLYVLAYAYGRLLLGDAGSGAAVPAFEMDWGDWLGSLQALWDWALALGRPLAVGLPALAITLALAGYVAVQLAWRAHVTLAWRARQKKRMRG